MCLTPLEKKMVLTLAYSAQFDQPLSLEQLEQRLLQVKTDQHLDISNLLNSNLVNYQHDYITLATHQIKSSKLESKIKSSQLKIAQAQPLVRWLKRLPWVKAVAVTGSVAVDNAGVNDDLDFLIVTGQQRLWLVRPVVLFLAIIFGKRRDVRGNHRDNSWCFNLFLEETTLKMEPDQHNIYTAYEVLQAKFIYDRAGVEARWLAENAWVQPVLPNFYRDRLTEVKNKQKKVESRQTYENKIWLVLNWIFFKLQYWYMKPKITRERISLQVAFFHPRDTKGWINQRWERELLDLLTV